MFHGSRGIGGGPFTPTIPRCVAPNRLSFRVAANGKLRDKKEYAVGDRLFESTCRHTPGGTKCYYINPSVSLHNAFAFAFAVSLGMHKPLSTEAFPAIFRAICSCINDKIQVGRARKAKGKIFLLHYRWFLRRRASVKAAPHRYNWNFIFREPFSVPPYLQCVFIIVDTWDVADLIGYRYHNRYVHIIHSLLLSAICINWASPLRPSMFNKFTAW